MALTLAMIALIVWNIYNVREMLRMRYYKTAVFCGWAAGFLTYAVVIKIIEMLAR